MGGIFFGNDLLKKGSDSEMMNMLAMNFVVIFIVIINLIIL